MFPGNVLLVLGVKVEAGPVSGWPRGGPGVHELFARIHANVLWSVVINGRQYRRYYSMMLNITRGFELNVQKKAGEGKLAGSQVAGRKNDKLYLLCATACH